MMNYKIKKYLPLLVCFFIIGNTLSLSVAAFSLKPHIRESLDARNIDNEEYEFENVYVAIDGKCRGISSYGEWDGHWYNGSAIGIAAIADGTPGEYLKITIRSIYGIKIFTANVTNGVLVAKNVNGKFYWSAKGWGVSEIPPDIYIRCHAAGKVTLVIREGHGEKNFILENIKDVNPQVSDEAKQSISIQKITTVIPKILITPTITGLPQISQKLITLKPSPIIMIKPSNPVNQLSQIQTIQSIPTVIQNLVLNTN